MGKKKTLALSNQEIRELIMAGHTRKDIADRCGVSVFTVSQRLKQDGGLNYSEVVWQRDRERIVNLVADNHDGFSREYLKAEGLFRDSDLLTWRRLFSVRLKTESELIKLAAG